MRLLRHIAHQEPKTRIGDELRRDEHTSVVAFRQVPRRLPALWQAYFHGEADEAASDLALRLLEKASARHKASDVQDDLRALRTFFEDEAAPLREAVKATAFSLWPVPQRERDPLFLRWRALA